MYLENRELRARTFFPSTGSRVFNTMIRFKFFYRYLHLVKSTISEMYGPDFCQTKSVFDVPDEK